MPNWIYLIFQIKFIRNWFNVIMVSRPYGDGDEINGVYFFLEYVRTYSYTRKVNRTRAQNKYIVEHGEYNKVRYS